jgi:hypothetical protein
MWPLELSPYVAIAQPFPCLACYYAWNSARSCRGYRFLLLAFAGLTLLPCRPWQPIWERQSIRQAQEQLKLLVTKVISTLSRSLAFD